MDTVYKVIGIAVMTAIIAVMLRKTHPEFAIMTSILAGIFIFYLIFDSLSYIVANINNLVSQAGIDSDIVAVVLKICGIAIVSEYFCNIIADTGETATAKKAELATKIIIFAMTIPIVYKVVENVFSIF